MKWKAPPLFSYSVIDDCPTAMLKQWWVNGIIQLLLSEYTKRIEFHTARDPTNTPHRDWHLTHYRKATFWSSTQYTTHYGAHRQISCRFEWELVMYTSSSRSIFKSSTAIRNRGLFIILWQNVWCYNLEHSMLTSNSKHNVEQCDAFAYWLVPKPILTIGQRSSTRFSRGPIFFLSGWSGGRNMITNKFVDCKLSTRSPTRYNIWRKHNHF